MEKKICPICGNPYTGHPALSRTDDKTEICPDCGIRQSLQSIGIAPEDVPRVFEKGYTGYNGRGGQKSTGLGLYLVHQTAEMLHCRVSLSSRIGEGTSVTIDLHQEELGKE